MREIFRKYLDNNCSPDEVRKLLGYFNIGENETLLRRLITEWLEENEEDEEENQWLLNFHEALLFIKKHLSMEVGKLIAFFRIIEFQAEAKLPPLSLPRFSPIKLYRSIKIIENNHKRN